MNTVGCIARRVVQRLRPKGQLARLRVIGIDELSYRRHHKYITIVTNHETGEVVWAREGKKAATLDAFYHRRLWRMRLDRPDVWAATCTKRR